jgi:hypothetical protein
MSRVLVPRNARSVLKPGSITNHKSAEGKRGATGKFSPPPQRRHVARTPAPVLRWELAERGCPRMLAAVPKGSLKGRAMFSG